MICCLNCLADVHFFSTIRIEIVFFFVPSTVLCEYQVRCHRSPYFTILDILFAIASALLFCDWYWKLFGYSALIFLNIGCTPISSWMVSFLNDQYVWFLMCNVKSSSVWNAAFVIFYRLSILSLLQSLTSIIGLKVNPIGLWIYIFYKVLKLIEKFLCFYLRASNEIKIVD